MINETHIETKFAIGELVQHKFLAFRGVIFDIDPSFNNTEEWYLAIPKILGQEKINLFIIY